MSSDYRKRYLDDYARPRGIFFDVRIKIDADTGSGPIIFSYMREV